MLGYLWVVAPKVYQFLGKTVILCWLEELIVQRTRKYKGIGQISTIGF